jgi:hypothetical protein
METTQEQIKDVQNLKAHLPDSGILDEILKELKRSKKKSFPVHVVAQATTISVPASAIVNDAHFVKYSTVEQTRQDSLKAMELNAIKTAAACIRFIESLRKEK